MFAWVSLLTCAKLTHRLAWVSLLAYAKLSDSKVQENGPARDSRAEPVSMLQKDEPTRGPFAKPNTNTRDSLMEQMHGFAFIRPIYTISNCVARVNRIAAHSVCPHLPSPRYSLRTEVDYPRVSGSLKITITSSTKNCSAK